MVAVLRLKLTQSPEFLMKSILCVAAAISFASCTQVTRIKEVTTGGISKMTDASRSSIAKLMPAKVPIVKVREEDLKDLPSGEQQALAFEKTRRNRFWIFKGPVDFIEPQLPAGEGELDGNLLPPKME